MATATIRSRGQVTIPVNIRKQLGVKSGDQIEFRFNKVTGRYEVYPVTRTLVSLKGIMKTPTQAASIEDMNRAIAE
jgi:antitoxin PrlF